MRKTKPKKNKTTKISLRGDELLNAPSLNKGTAFTLEERIRLGLLGKLPHKVETLENQVKRAYLQFKSLESPKRKNIFLNELYNTNQVLLYMLVSENIQEMVPILYTPHVAHNCQTFSQEFRRPQGLHMSYPDRKHLAKIIDNRPHKDIDLIVVTDGERILGIGDQGVGGIGIPVGKLMLYSLFGAIDPVKTLPIVLDVGTNNKELLKDPMYLGWRHPRIKGEQYKKFLNDFVRTVKRKLPNLRMLHWEDFSKNNAPFLLKHYRKKICSFNDDIQGTAVVTVAALLAAIKISKQKLTDQRIVIIGAGSASIGIADLITSALVRVGMSKNEAYKCFWMIDSSGLLTKDTKTLSPQQKPYARSSAENKQKTRFFDVVKNVRPTILIGCSTVSGLFTKKIVQQMTKNVQSPIIFPLSNPTANCEAVPEDLIEWTKGKALISTGSPFEAVKYKAKKYTIAQCNNAIAFPGIGLGVIASRAKEVTDELLWAAVEILYKEAPCLKNRQAPLLPPIEKAPKIAKKIAKKVAALAIKNGLSPYSAKTNVAKLISEYSWKPEYKQLKSTVLKINKKT